MDREEIRKRYYSSITPPELALELLTKAGAHIVRARRAFSEKRFEEANNRITDAQDIYAELCGIMRGDDAQSKCAAAFFSLMEDTLFYANLNLDLQLLDEARVMNERLRTTFAVQIGKPHLG